MTLTSHPRSLARRRFGRARPAVVRAREQRSDAGRSTRSAAYGFRSASVAEESAADLRAGFGDLAEATGAKALARFERLRAGERGLRELLDSAGMYHTSVAAFVGSRILFALSGPALLFLCRSPAASISGCSSGAR